MENRQRYKVEEIKVPRVKKIKTVFGAFSIFLIIILLNSISYNLGFNSANHTSSIPPDIVPQPSITIKNNLSATSTLTGKILSSTPTPLPKSLVVNSEMALDGFILNNKTTFTDAEIKVGSNKFISSRGFLSFNLEKVPKNSKVISVLLRLYQVRTSGNPYLYLGSIFLDHVLFGDVLDGIDFNIPSFSENYDIVSKNKETGWKEIIVTDLVVDDLDNKRSKSQFRIHFKNEKKGETEAGDFAYFESSDNSEGTGNIPQLIIKYY